MRTIALLAALPLLLAGCGATAPRPAAVTATAAAAAGHAGKARPAAAGATATASPTGAGATGPSAATASAATASGSIAPSPGAASAPAAAATASGGAGSTTAAPAATLRLTPGRWAPAGTQSACGSVLTSDLVAYGEADGAVTPGTGGRLAVYLHNNTSLCHAAGRTLHLSGTAWRLYVVPLGATAAAASVGLPAPPATLAPGAELRLPVRVGAGLQPGWYLAVPRAAGQPGPPAAAMPALQASERFLVTAGPRPAGRVTADAYPTPAVGGLAMPLVSVAWSGRDVAVVTVHAAVACGPGTDRYASFEGATATASGPGFTTALPDIGGGQNPAVAQVSWDLPFPGEATVLTLSARVQVRACGSGAVLGNNGIAWRVNLPG